MTMNDRNIISTLFRLTTDDVTKNDVLNIVNANIDKLNNDIKSLQEKLKYYEMLKKEINEKEV